MSQYFSSVPDEGGNIDKRKDLVGFRGSIGRHPRWRTGQFFVGHGEPRFHHKDLPAAEVAPRKQLGAPCSPSPHSALSLHPTTWSDRGAFKTLLAAHAQLFVCSWEFLRKKKKRRRNVQETRGALGRAPHFRSRNQRSARSPSRRGPEAGVGFSSLGSAARATPGDALPAVPAGRVGARGSPGSPSGAGRDHSARTEGGIATSARAREAAGTSLRSVG